MEKNKQGFRDAMVHRCTLSINTVYAQTLAQSITLAMLFLERLADRGGEDELIGST